MDVKQRQTMDSKAIWIAVIAMLLVAFLSGALNPVLTFFQPEARSLILIIIVGTVATLVPVRPFSMKLQDWVGNGLLVFAFFYASYDALVGASNGGSASTVCDGTTTQCYPISLMTIFAGGIYLFLLRILLARRVRSQS